MATHTLESVEASLLDYADFEEVGSVSRAKSFLTAALRFQALAPDSESNQSSSMSIGKQWLSDETKRARAYIAANATSSSGAQRGVSFLSVNHGFR